MKCRTLCRSLSVEEVMSAKINTFIIYTREMSVSLPLCVSRSPHSLSVYICTRTHTYIYIYVDRERERERAQARGRASESRRASEAKEIVCVVCVCRERDKDLCNLASAEGPIGANCSRTAGKMKRSPFIKRIHHSSQIVFSCRNVCMYELQCQKISKNLKQSALFSFCMN
jgi:hypothetical protein